LADVASFAFTPLVQAPLPPQAILQGTTVSLRNIFSQNNHLASQLVLDAFSAPDASQHLSPEKEHLLHIMCEHHLTIQDMAQQFQGYISLRTYAGTLEQLIALSHKLSNLYRDIGIRPPAYVEYAISSSSSA